MNSPFANIYLALIAQLQTNVPELQWIDHDLGQLEAYDGDRPPVAWPCLLIDFNETSFEQRQRHQDAEMLITLRLAHDQYQQTHAEVPEYVQQQALQYYEVEYKVHQALQAQGLSLLVNPLIRVSATTEKRENDNFRVRRLVYKATFVDASVTG